LEKPHLENPKSYLERPKLLFVDDDESIRQTLPLVLSANGFEVTTVATVCEALSEINRQPFDILLSDLHIGQPGDGFTVVSAMRSIQPQARTYILTGYPDFASALEAIRLQVDSYLIKPSDIPSLLKTLRTKQDRPRLIDAPGKRASAVIRENAEAIVEKWVEKTEGDEKLKEICLPKAARIDYLPDLLRQLANQLDKKSEIKDKRDLLESAAAHGKRRREQGYSVAHMFAESQILYCAIAETVQSNILQMDLSSIIPDLIQISDNLNGMVAESLRSFFPGESVAA
jgi:ActR/RegA family two-component response regulator